MKLVAKFVIVLGCGYILGWIIPPWHIIPENSGMSQAESYETMINLLTAIGTIAAVIVALFLNEIRSCFKAVKLDARLHSDEFKEDVEDVKKIKRATRYYNELLIVNSGNLNALNCELYIESAKIIYRNNSIRQLHIPNDQVWGGISGKEIYIPSDGKKIIPLFELLQPEEQSTPDGNLVSTLPRLKILGIDELTGIDGVVHIEYCIYAVNSHPLRFQLSLDWTGKWEQRKEEMKNLLKLKIEKNE